MREAPTTAFGLRELLRHHLRVALGSTSLWLVVLASGPLTAVALRRTTNAGEQAIDLGVEALVAATATTMLGLPFVIARVGSSWLRQRDPRRITGQASPGGNTRVGADHVAGRAHMGRGHGASALVLARFCALAVAMVITLLPPLVAVAALALTGAAAFDAGAVATMLLGQLCAGISVIGVGLLAAALTSSPAAAAASTLALTAGAWALRAAHAPGSFALPTAALEVFAHGLIDGRDVVSLLGGGLGTALASAQLLSLTASRKQRALRCVGVLLLTALGCGASSQLRASLDLTADAHASLAPEYVTALAGIDDRVHATLHLQRDDARVEQMERAVLLPLRRYVKVRVHFDDAGASQALATWRVGAQQRMSDTFTADGVVPIVLELGGVSVPHVLARPRLPRHPREVPPVVVWLLWGVCPLLATLILVCTRRR